MKNKTLIVGLMIVMSLAATANAQITTYGRVYGTDGVLEWAMVRWVGTNYCDTTCPFGNWMLQDLPATDSVKLEAWHQGYYAQTQWVKSGGTSFWLEPLPEGTVEQRGDFNLNGEINIADIVATVGYVLRGKPGSMWPEAVDFNCDGESNTADIIGMVNFVLRAGPGSSCSGLTRPRFPYDSSPAGC